MKTYAELIKEIEQLHRVIEAYSREVRALATQQKVMRDQLKDVAKTTSDMDAKLRTIRVHKGVLV